MVLCLLQFYERTVNAYGCMSPVHHMRGRTRESWSVVENAPRLSLMGTPNSGHPKLCFSCSSLWDWLLLMESQPHRPGETESQFPKPQAWVHPSSSIPSCHDSQLLLICPPNCFPWSCSCSGLKAFVVGSKWSLFSFVFHGSIQLIP